MWMNFIDYQYRFKVDVGAFAGSLKWMALGMVGIFFVTALIIGSVYLLNRLSSEQFKQKLRRFFKR
ncbi:MAG: hypothetical protein WDA00_03950 [Eubacteriales bacterium]